MAAIVMMSVVLMVFLLVIGVAMVGEGVRLIACTGLYLRGDLGIGFHSEQVFEFGVQSLIAKLE